MPKLLPNIVSEHIRAVNTFDSDAIVATFAEDAFVNDSQREIVGTSAIRQWLETEIVGYRVTMTVREIRDHYGDPIVSCLYDGNYDKTNLPKELILTNYFTVRNGKIAALILIRNKPSPY